MNKELIVGKFVRFMLIALSLFLIVGVSGMFFDIWPAQVVAALFIFLSALGYGAWLNVRYRS